MEKDNDIRDLVDFFRQRRQQQRKSQYQWRVQILHSAENILAAIRQRKEPDYKPDPYTVTANFNAIEEALEYQYMVELRGNTTKIYNNWTGEEYVQK